MEFISTRGKDRATGAEAVVKGIASDGGLFVPAEFPAVTAEEFSAMLEMDYPERAAVLLRKFFGEYDPEGLQKALKEGYAAFDEGDAAPLLRMDNGMYMLELFHGPTCADKDLSFAVFPYLLREGLALTGTRGKVLLLAASSGDAGKAALEAFKDDPCCKVVVFYPDEGVSKMQKLQLCTQDGENVDVVAVKGSFDDCRAGVKKLLGSDTCKAAAAEKGYLLSTANSFNIGRLLPQVCYFFSAYLDLVSSEQIRMGDKIDFTLPAGSFGGLLAAYYAKRMGLPVGTLLAASNRNNALTDFFRRGVYDVRHPLAYTMSPSLDVLYAYNIERLLFELSGRDGALTEERMVSLAHGGRFTVRAEELKAMNAEFFADFAGEDDSVECMYDFFTDYGYPMDTHTGVAMCVAERFAQRSGEDDAESRPMVVVSPASPYKFPQDVLYALTGNDVKDSFKGVKRIHLLTAMKVPEALKAVRYKPLRFKTSVSADKMADEIKKFLS